MKISLKWLSDYVDIKDYFRKPEELGEILTQAGLEVEEIHSRARDLSHVVIGVIIEKDKHPNADKLSLCKVATGEGVVHQIVCGAQNHKANDRVVVALPGAVLPGNLQIKNSTIRGVESGGMLCSLKELGLPLEGDGIVILPADAPVGKSYAEYAGFDDVTFELKVTPNRADCLSHYGLAREISCLLKRELKVLQPVFKISAESTKKEVGLQVLAPDLCPRYSGRVIKGVRVEAAPAWIRQRLEAVGLNSINNIVDVTNYVMMELGQPLHAFDIAKLAGASLVVDRAAAGEKFVTLDGTELTLTGAELTIRDAEKAVALAGTVGALNSGITDDTHNLFLESAYFSPVSVRKTSRGLGLDTDSAYRFSRGVDPDGAVRALDRATEIILQVAGGEAYSDHYDFYPEPVKKDPVVIEIQTITDRLGFEAQETKFIDYMRRLGCEPDAIAPMKYSVKVPTFRVDIEHEMDLVEEYARLEGYHFIPETVPAFTEAPTAHDKNFILQQKVSEALRASGYSQAINFSFTSAKGQKEFLQGPRGAAAAGLTVSEEDILLRNPLSDELNAMRSGLTFGLYRNMLGNFHHGNEVGRLFEMGANFFLRPDKTYGEGRRLGLIAWGQPQDLWNPTPKSSIVFDVKAAVENLLGLLNITNFSWVSPSDRGEVPLFMHRGQYAQLSVEGKKIGFLGHLHPARLDGDKVRVAVAAAELDLELLLQGQPRAYRTESLSKMPSVQRDFAFILPKTLKVGDVLQAVRKIIGPTLVKTEIFDVYEGEKLEAGKKSVAFRITLQDKNGTLQESQLTEIQNKVIEGLKSQFAVTLR